MTPPNQQNLVYQEIWEHDILGVEWRLYVDRTTGHGYWVPMVSYPDFNQAQLKEPTAKE